MSDSVRPETATMILDAAEQLFEQKGYAAVSMREICTACGVTKPTLYYYFADKEALYVATLLRRLEGMRTLLQPQVPAEPIRTRLIRLATHVLTRMRTNVDIMMRDMENITAVEHHQRLGEAFAHELYHPLFRALSQGITAGELRPGDPAIYTKLYLGLLNAFIGGPAQHLRSRAVSWATVPADPAERAALIVDLVLHGIAND